MRFDVVIIGGGLAGLAAGIRLQRGGCSCALVHAGQSALHFSSGSLDFLNSLPDGSPVLRPEEALPVLAKAEPEHPYALLGVEKTLTLGREAEKLLAETGLAFTGSLAQGNHTRITPLGGFCLTWLSAADLLAAEPEKPLPWQRVLLANIEGFLDFYPEILAERLAHIGVKSECRYLTLPALEVLRQNPSEFRSVNLARVIDLPENLELFAATLREMAKDFDAVLLPACLGQQSHLPLQRLGHIVGKKVLLVPTLPPSLAGARLSHALVKCFLEAGGTHMPGDKVVGFALSGGRVDKAFTVNHEDIPLEAEDYLLASGSFFSNGLKADQAGVREAVFNLDLTEQPGPRQGWTAESVFDPQPYARFGVKVDAGMRTFIDGTLVSNLFAAGMVLGNYDAVRLGCGAGVALTTALAAADSILNGRSAT